jgi:hypothetical protein
MQSTASQWNEYLFPHLFFAITQHPSFWVSGKQGAVQTIMKPNLPFDEWTNTFEIERLTGALLDRFTHQIHILEMNGESYRLKHSRQSGRA